MDHSARMGCLERRGDLSSDADRFVDRQPAAFQSLLEILTRNQLHRDETA